MPTTFLSARWKHLLMLNWTVDPALLQAFVPEGTVLDQHGGATWISLVAFMFLDTRLKGVAVPLHTDFEEINLRLYVRRPEPDPARGTDSRRGVVFVRELVPRPALAAVARWAYNERYRSTRMWHRRRLGEDALPDTEPLARGQRLVYGWRAPQGRVEVAATVAGPAADLVQGSHEQFIAEHYWGYARQRDGGTVEYEVTHPSWQVHPVRQVAVSGELAWEYGDELGSALDRAPDTAFVAAGSEVAVKGGARLPENA